MLAKDVLEYILYGKIAHRILILNPAVTLFLPQNRNADSKVTDTNPAVIVKTNDTNIKTKNEQLRRMQYAKTMSISKVVEEIQ